MKTYVTGVRPMFLNKPSFMISIKNFPDIGHDTFMQTELEIKHPRIHVYQLGEQTFINLLI